MNAIIRGGGDNKGGITKRWLNQRFFSVFAVPMALNQWAPAPIGSFPLPSVRTESESWQITTKENAGGYLYRFEASQVSPLSNVAVSWRWKVDQSPVRNAFNPTEKDSDDYALRVGVVIGGDGEALLPKEFRKASERLAAPVSYVVFYSATEKHESAGRCYRSPFSERVINCLSVAGKQLTTVRATPYKDLADVIALSTSAAKRLSALGIWVFADSDNTKSSSAASLERLRVETGKKLH